MFCNMCQPMTWRNNNVTTTGAVGQVPARSTAGTAKSERGEERVEDLCCKEDRSMDVPFKNGAAVLSVL